MAHWEEGDVDPRELMARHARTLFTALLIAAALFLLSYFSFSPLRVERRSNPSSSVQSPTSAAPPSSAVTVSEAGEPKADDSSPKPTVPAASASAVDFSSILEPPDIIPSSAPASDGSRPAVSAAETWLEEIDGGKYAQSWKDAAAFFQSVVSEENWKSALVTFRSPLGKAEVRKLRAARIVKSLPGAPDGNYVVMQFKTSFAAKKAAFETVTFMRGSDGQWRAAGYFIR